MVAGLLAAVGITKNSPLTIRLLEVVIFPVTLRLDSVPTEVMLGCAAVVTVPDVVADPDTSIV